MNKFNLPDQDDTKLIVDTHYHNWLLEQGKTDIDSIQTKKEYLLTLGFQLGIDRLDEEDIFRLNTIENTYFDIVCKPKLQDAQITTNKPI